MASGKEEPGNSGNLKNETGNKLLSEPLGKPYAVFLSMLLTAKQQPTGKNSFPGTLKLHRSSLEASGKMIKRKKHPVIGCFFFV